MAVNLPNQVNPTNSLFEQNTSAQVPGSDLFSMKSQDFSPTDDLIILQGGGQLKGRKSQYKNATNPDKIEQAKRILSANNYQLEYLLENSDFRGYDKTSDFRRYLRKFVYNNKSKNSKIRDGNKSEHSDLQSESQMQIDEEISQNNVDIHLPQANQMTQLMGATIQINQGAIVGYEELLAIFENFKSSNQLEKAQILQEITLRNTQSLFQFVNLFANAVDANLTSGLFSLLIDLINNYNKKDQDSKSRILLSAFHFYRGEVITIDEYLIKECCILLTQSPNLMQILGLVNYVFVNEVSAFAIQEEIIKKLNSRYSNIVSLMGETFNAFEIDRQVRRLLPPSLHIFNAPFISILKDESGLALIRDIPPIYTPYFVKICALSTYFDSKALNEYILMTRTTFIQKQEQINEKSLLCFMKSLSERLEARQAQWIGKIEQIKQLQFQIIEAHIEKGVSIDASIIQNCLNGDCSELQRVLHLPKAMEEFSEEMINKMLKMFEEANESHPLASVFNKLSKNEKLQVSDNLQKLQQILGFKLYCSQIVAINYIFHNLKDNHLMHFGIGNGKTLICITLAILLASSYNHSVFIISKNEHLVQRDFVKYEKVIGQMTLNANLNAYSKQRGIYFYTLPQLKKQMANEKFISIWAESVAIVDEYDWILLDGSQDVVVNTLKFFSLAKTIIGFSGSTPSNTEQKCLKLALNTTPVIFSSLDRLKGDKKTQRTDILINTNQGNYVLKLKEIISEQVKYSPVLIVAQSMYKAIDAALSGCGLDFYSLSQNSASVIESVIEGRYLMKNSRKEYGVYLLNEAHGRGTDIQTNDEINNNGGSFLIIADIFTRRSEEQIIGRIGRLNTRGQWQRVLLRTGAKDSIEQLLFVEQNSAELQLNSKYCKVQQKLEEMNELKQESKEQDKSENNDKSQENENKTEKTEIVIENKENPEDKKQNETDEKDQEKIQKDLPIEDQKEKDTEESKEKDSSKLGFYQPTIIECIEQQLSQNPVNANKPFKEVQDNLRIMLKRRENQISKTPNRSRSSSKSSKKTNKRGRPRKVIQDQSDDDNLFE